MLTHFLRRLRGTQIQEYKEYTKTFSSLHVTYTILTYSNIPFDLILRNVQHR